MARIELPLVVLDTAGNAVQGASVRVNNRGGALATVYQFETGATPQANPLTSDAAGRVTGWVDPGAYEAVISKAGLASYTEAFEAVSGTAGGNPGTFIQDASIPAGKLAPGAVGAAALGADVPVFPVGGMFVWPYGEAGIPSWTAVPYGQALPQANYPALHALAAAAGYPHGGDATQVLLPDMRGRVAMGKDDMGGVAAARVTAAVSGVQGGTLGYAGGVQGVTLTTAQLPAHTHGLTGSPGFSDPGHVHTQHGDTAYGDRGGFYWNNTTGGGADTSRQTQGHGTGASVTIGTLGTLNAGSGGAHGNVQPVLVVNKIMRVT